MTSDQDRAARRDRVAQLYRDGSTTREIAALVGCEATSVRHDLRRAGEPVRRRGPRRHLDVDAIVNARGRGQSWDAVARAVGASRTGVRKAYYEATGLQPTPTPHRRRHLTSQDIRELRRHWRTVPTVAGRARKELATSLQGQIVAALIAWHRQSGVSAPELAAAIGVKTRYIEQFR